MLKALSFEVTFPTTGRTFKRDLTFDKGMTAITGRNEQGKSLVIEFARFCLFGTEALRGSAEDYKSLKASLTFSVKADTYRVERTITNAKLFKGDEEKPSVVGVRPVNARVIQILGFGMDVFDIACAANQGDVEKLAQMRPTERKRMVDRVIGVDRIDEIMKWCGEEALLLSREIATLERGLVEPVKPTEPAGYRPSADLQHSVAMLRVAQRELDGLQGWLRNEPVRPTEPVRPHTYTQADLERAEKLLATQTYDFDREALAAEWTAFTLWQQREAFDRYHPRPNLNFEQALLYQSRVHFERELERLRKSPVITCPCGKPFRTTDEDIAVIEMELAELPVFEGVYDPTQEIVRNKDWARPETLAEWEQVKDAVETKRPSVPHTAVIAAETKIHVIERDQQIADLGLTGVDVKAALSQLRTFEAQTAVYDERLKAWEEWQAEAEQKRACVLELKTSVAALPEEERQLQEALLYEQALNTWANQSEAYEIAKAEVETKKAEREAWVAAKNGLSTLRDKIKTYLVPSLSKVASHLINQMTGGERTSIVVDEDFEVTVDGQPLSTLSGSGKACANLALRIGLGQVLTNNVFSIFIGDEIDASMDQSRADNLQMSLETILSRISQIVLITHKIPRAKQVIAFGESNGRRVLEEGAGEAGG